MNLYENYLKPKYLGGEWPGIFFIGLSTVNLLSRIDPRPVLPLAVHETSCIHIATSQPTLSIAQPSNFYYLLGMK